MRKFTPLALVSLVLCLGACVKTDLNDENGSRTPGSGLVGDGPFYMSFRLAMAGGDGTRADDGYVDEESGDNFVYGSEAEYAVRNFMILFFDDFGRQVYHVTSGEQEPTGGEEDIEKEFGKLITISLGDNEDDIKKTKDALESVKSFVTILNYNPLWDQNGSNLYALPLGEVINVTGAFSVAQYHCAYEYEIENKDKDGNSVNGKGFVMSTAGHYEDGEAGYYIFYDTCDAEDEEKQIFYQTISDAQNHPVTITVERLAARVDIEIIENIEPIEVLYGTDVYVLNFVPDRWGLEAEEKDEFIMKNQRAKRSYNDADFNYPAGYGTWTDYKLHRTFWAESPTFNGNNNPYAWEGDEIKKNKDLALKYTTFDKLYRSFVKKEDNDDIFTHKTASAYTTEHTFAVSELNKNTTKNPYAVPTSIVVGGKYSVTYLTTDERPKNPSQKEGDDLKLNGAGFYLRFVDMERTDDPERDGEEDDYPGFKRYQYRLYRETNDDGKDDLFEALLKEQFVIFYKGEDGGYYPVNVYTFFDDMSVASKIFEIANTSANQYTLQLKSDIDFNSSLIKDLYYGLYVDSPAGPVYTQLASNNIAEANEALKNQLGYAQRYYQGYAFFYAPIPHYTGTGSPFANGYSGLFNYKKTAAGAYEIDAAGRYVIDHKNGEFGVVRNHIYKITVNGFSTLGQGIPSEDAIPLPEPRIEHDIWQFDLTLKVLPWNQFQYTFDI